jgi:Zn-dependent membrane protease YugP
MFFLFDPIWFLFVIPPFIFMMLRGSGLVSVEEYGGARAVLSAAALTYVASFLMALAQLMYFVFLAIGLGRR